MPKGILVFGANGSGKSTLGRELARILNYKYMDIEDYHFVKSDIPYTVERSDEECIKLMLNDIEKYQSFVISAVTGDFCAEISSMYDLAVFMSAPLDIRIERIKQRAIDQHGERVCEGGDMYEQQLNFFNFVANRPVSRIERWAETLTCPTISVDGTKPISENVNLIIDKYLNNFK